MRICVSTLKTSEQEYPACKRAIEEQKEVSFEHVVYENLPNHEAHLRLFGDFLKEKDQWDILVKVDADTVLRGDQVLSRIAALFAADSEIEQIQFQLYDFFTAKAIWGLNCYRNTIILKEQDPLFVDRFVTRSYGKKLDLEGEIVGDHSPDPSDFQCVHFGFHRQLKRQYKQVILPMLKAYIRSFDRRRALALVGCILVQKGVLSEKHNLQYEDPLIVKLTETYSRRHGFILFLIVITGFASYFVKKLPLLFARADTQDNK